ncbi:MAG: FkbM family methyltransferase, partial [Candidatus Limnocylindrales bacterium]
MPQPSCSCCYDDAFDQAHAQRVLRAYRKKGPGRASVAIADALAGDDATGMTVLDIGANIGLYSAVASRIVGPTGRIIAIEPGPHNCEFIRRTIELNGL